MILQLSSPSSSDKARQACQRLQQRTTRKVGATYDFACGQQMEDDTHLDQVAALFGDEFTEIGVHECTRLVAGWGGLILRRCRMGWCGPRVAARRSKLVWEGGGGARLVYDPSLLPLAWAPHRAAGAGHVYQAL
jgi:hypothetical protein